MEVAKCACTGMLTALLLTAAIADRGLPRLETRNRVGWGPGRIDNLDRAGNPTPNGISSAAIPGSLARISVADVSIRQRAELFLGNKPLQIMSRQNVDRALTLTFRIPLQAPEGCYVPLHLNIDGAPVRNSVAMSVDASGTCRLPSYQPSTAWSRNKSAVAVRIHETGWFPETGQESNSVHILSAFFEGDGKEPRLGPMLYLPPPGLCSTHTRPFDSARSGVETIVPLLLDDPGGRTLDNGPFLNLDDRHRQIRIPVSGQPGFYWQTIASPNRRTPLDLTDLLRLRGLGSGDVGQFQVPLAPPAVFRWSNRPAGPILDLRHDLSFAWNNGLSGVVLAVAGVADPSAGELSYCLCVAKAGTARFDIPKQILRNLRTAQQGEAAGALYLIHLPEQASTFRANGIDTGFGYGLQLHSTTLIFRP